MPPLFGFHPSQKFIVPPRPVLLLVRPTSPIDLRHLQSQDEKSGLSSTEHPVFVQNACPLGPAVRCARTKENIPSVLHPAPSRSHLFEPRTATGPPQIQPLFSFQFPLFSQSPYLPFLFLRSFLPRFTIRRIRFVFSDFSSPQSTRTFSF